MTWYELRKVSQTTATYEIVEKADNLEVFPTATNHFLLRDNQNSLMKSNCVVEIGDYVFFAVCPKKRGVKQENGNGEWSRMRYEAKASLDEFEEKEKRTKS